MIRITLYMKLKKGIVPLLQLCLTAILINLLIKCEICWKAIYSAKIYNKLRAMIINVIGFS